MKQIPDPMNGHIIKLRLDVRVDSGVRYDAWFKFSSALELAYDVSVWNRTPDFFPQNPQGHPDQGGKTLTRLKTHI